MEFSKYFLRNHSRGHGGEQDGDLPRMASKPNQGNRIGGVKNSN